MNGYINWSNEIEIKTISTILQVLVLFWLQIPGYPTYRYAAQSQGSCLLVSKRDPFDYWAVEPAKKCWNILIKGGQPKPIIA